MARILVDGSSTAYGLWGGESGGWADRLKMSIMCAADRRQFASVVNLAAPLRTVVEIADELPLNARTYGGNNPAKVGLFMLGMSESRRLASGLVVPPREFAQAVERIGSSCRAADFAPIFVGMPPVDESRTFDFGKERACYTNDERARYDGIVKDYAAANGFTYVDIAAELASQFPDPSSLFDEDGLHMNSLGHAVIHDAVLPIVVVRLHDLKHTPMVLV
ncbi:SGNH/GDSL hydrolase family protein [Antrihabitans stalactiti]|uniref:SGNH/GDSL hydrolase family protein n=1 Tax=Antrihabitans stalactiti TaxID=2584121 RepID=A0A848K7U9_9NOCA|nr:SGNH/GDSL hydrolase family protein [Antrihabitans stalactiti]NMN93686.1 SGNH/GDSL hydrolase family protein [Antrihabitans stalactiti]